MRIFVTTIFPAQSVTFSHSSVSDACTRFAITILLSRVIGHPKITMHAFSKRNKYLLITLVLMMISITSVKCFPYVIKEVAGRRCCIGAPAAVVGLEESSKSSKPPLIIIGGTAQSIPSWEFHINSLSRTRRVLFYECVGQGSSYDVEDLKDVSLGRQAQVFEHVVNQAFPDTNVVDIAGFSFGGRVALAAASSLSMQIKIRKLHLTGVSAERDAYARLVIANWKYALRSSKGSLVPFAWSSLMLTHSQGFLTKNEDRVTTWVDLICKSNTVNGILALLEQTHPENGDDEWHPVVMASRIASNQSVQSGKLVVGSADHLCSSIKNVERLKDIIGWTGSVIVYAGCGHAVAIENATQWRNDLVQFLDGNE